jgi:hypothetical protein
VDSRWHTHSRPCGICPQLLLWLLLLLALMLLLHALLLQSLLLRPLLLQQCPPACCMCVQVLLHGTPQASIADLAAVKPAAAHRGHRHMHD